MLLLWQRLKIAFFLWRWGAAAGLPSYHNEEGNLIIYQRIIQLPMVESHNSLVVSLGTVLKAIVTIKYLYDQKILK